MPKTRSLVSLFVTALYLIPAASAQAPSLASESPAVHGATFQDGIASGGWATIRGANFTTVTRIWAGSDFNGNRLPESLEGVSVKINGKPAYIYFVSPTQLNVLAPDDTTQGPVDIEVTNAAGTARGRATLRRVAPGFFAFDPMNKMYAAAVHLDGVLAGPANLFSGAVAARPFSRGGRGQLYGSGFGDTTPPLAAGLIVAGAAPLAAPPTLTLGGRPMTLEFGGRTGSGLEQFNVIIPDVAAGDQPLLAQSGDARSQSNLYLCIAPAAPANLGIASDTVAMSLAAGAGGRTETVAVTSSAEPLGFVTNIEGSPLPRWLSVTKNAVTGSNISITANPAGLAPGSYNATIVVSSCAASNEPRRIAVTLTVTGTAAPPALNVSPSTLTFSGATGATVAAQNLSVTATGVVQTFTVQATTTTGGNWLTATPATASTPATVSVAVNLANLAAGSYDGQVRLATTGGTPVNIPVRLTVTSGGGGTISRLPRITSINPKLVPIGQPVDLEINGENLDSVYRVNFFWGQGMIVGTPRPTSTGIRVLVGAVAGDAAPGFRRVSVSTPAGDSNAEEFFLLGGSGPQPGAAGNRAPSISNVAVTSSANAGAATQSIRFNFADPDGDVRWNDPERLVSGAFVMPLTPLNNGCADLFGGNVFERPNIQSGSIIISNTFTYVTELRNVTLAVYMFDSRFNFSNVVMVNVPFYHTDCDLRPRANRAPTISNVQASSVANRNQATQQASFDFTDPNGDIKAGGFTRLFIVPRVAGNVTNCADVWGGSYLDRPNLNTGRINLNETFNWVTELRGSVPLEFILVDSEGNPSPPVSVTVPTWHTLCDIPGGVKPSAEQNIVDAQPASALPAYFGPSPRMRRADR